MTTDRQPSDYTSTLVKICLNCPWANWLASTHQEMDIIGEERGVGPTFCEGGDVHAAKKGAHICSVSRPDLA